MRVSPYWKEYKEIEEQYLAINCEMPPSVKADYRAKEYLDSLSRDLHRCADGNAISNETWELLAKVQEIEKNHSVSKEMTCCIEEALTKDADLSFDEWNEDYKSPSGYWVEDDPVTHQIISISIFIKEIEDDDFEEHKW